MHTGNLQREIDALGWQFDHSYARLPDYFYARVSPEPVSAPRRMLFNHELAEALGLRSSSLSDKGLAALFAGSALPSTAEPIAQAYAGHQFGHFTMLGDGRAVLLGEQITPSGARFDLQFKGSGRTPFSRRGDGRAALGPMLREYLISEAMHALGIATTRSLAVVTTGDWVYRDPPQPGAVLTRVASSHLRVGTFQYAAGYQRHQDMPSAAGVAEGSVGTDPASGARDGRSAVSTLLRYAIARHYPDREQSARPALEFLHAVIDQQISLLVHWMRVGFIHGVMNTDNMSIAGETIDYGPCAFMDAYHPDTVFSSIDHAGRYAFGNQPAIAQWNLARLAEALLTEIDSDADAAMGLASEAIASFRPQYESAWLSMMGRKLGFVVGSPADEDRRLIEDLLRWMQEVQADYTYTFWWLTTQLSGVQPNTPNDLSDVDHAPYTLPEFQSWMQRWLKRLGSEATSFYEAAQRMQRENPVVIPRNARVEEALSEAVEHQRLDAFHALLTQLQDPYSVKGKAAAYIQPPLPLKGYRTFCGT